jgi:hypothetical protein
MRLIAFFTLLVFLSFTSAQYSINSWDTQLTVLSGCSVSVRETINFNMSSFQTKIFTKFFRLIPGVYMSSGVATIGNITAKTPTSGVVITSAFVLEGQDVGTIQINFYNTMFPMDAAIFVLSYDVKGPLWSM